MTQILDNCSSPRGLLALVLFKIHSDLLSQLQSEASIHLVQPFNQLPIWKRGVTPLLGPKILFSGARPIIPEIFPQKLGNHFR